MAYSQPAVKLSEEIPAIPFEKYILPNGLEVILVEDHRLPLVAVNLWYHVGPANEEPGLTGFAHLFEHMMFAGSKHIPRGLADKLLEGAGATDFNGTTDFDRTNYYDTVPANQLELSLWIHADRMGYLLDVLDQTSLTNQQDVVRNERRQSIENQPYGIAEEALFHRLFPKTHPYHASVMGSHADIQSAQLADIRNFFKLYYVPNNASLAIVGDIQPAEAKQLVEKYFGSLKRGPTLPQVKAVTPPITQEQRVTVTDRVELPRVYMGWITSPIYQAGDAELDIAAHILGGGKTSRLYKKLVYELQIAQDVNVLQNSLQLGSVFTLQVTARPGHTATEIEAAVNAELDQLRRQGPMEQELEQAQNMIQTGLVHDLEKISGVADRLNRYNHYLGTPDYLKQDTARYLTATVASVHAVIKQQLIDTARVVIHAVPGEQQLPAEVPVLAVPTANHVVTTEKINSDEPWRYDIPKPQPLKIPQLPVPQSFQLSNGLTVLYLPQKKWPLISANLIIRAGREANPANKPGLAQFTAQMLDEGTTRRNALQIAEAVAQLGGMLETGSSPDASFIQMSSLKKNFAALLEIGADILLHPAFPQQEIKRQRAERLAELIAQRQNPSSIAWRTMAAALYGTDHPYGSIDLGTAASIKATTQRDLQQFWRQHYTPNNVALVVVGDIEPNDLRQLVEKNFAAWQPAPLAEPKLPHPNTTSARVVLADVTKAPQTALRIAGIGPARNTPDYEALETMNSLLGGLFSSRINQNLREEKGYTYGAYSLFQYRRWPGPFAISTSVKTDVTAPAITEILKEVRRMREEPVSEAELALAKDAQIKSLPAIFETTLTTAASLSSLSVYQLALDYYSQLPAKLNAVDVAQIQAVAKRYLAPDRLIVIAVGDRKKIEPAIAKLNLGKIELRDKNGLIKH